MRAANGISETTTSIAGTLGDGAVTTTAIANTPRVSSAFGTGAVVVRYIIAKGTTGAFETGIGSFSANVLTRTKPTCTWNGTTMVNTGTISPLQFSATPTSGDVTIRIAPLAESTAPVMPGRNATVAGDTTWRDYPWSQAFSNWGNSGAGQAIVADREYYYYYRLDCAGSLTGIQFEVTTLVAASNVKLALYSIGSDGLPANKIVDFVTVSSATTGVKTDTATGSWTPATGINLTPGWYAVGYIASHAISIRGGPSFQGMCGATPLGKEGSYGWSNSVYKAGLYTTGLPAVANLSGGTLISGSHALSALFMGLKIT
jgi:hypothetical protein